MTTLLVERGQQDAQRARAGGVAPGARSQRVRVGHCGGRHAGERLQEEGPEAVPHQEPASLCIVHCFSSVSIFRTMPRIPLGDPEFQRHSYMAEIF